MKSFKKFINDYKLGQNLKDYRITNYTINEDGSIDVDDFVSFAFFDLTKLPLKFRKVTGYFWCSHNKLTSLEGSPRSVGGYFDCVGNKLTSLEGGPESVGGDFYCKNNQLTSLEGSPKSVGGYFDCSHNQLTSLEGSPESVKGGFECSHNQLTSLEGCPQNAIFYDCRNNKLTSLQGLPEDIDRGYFDNNPVWEIYNLFKTIKCIKWLNEFDVIRGNTVIMDLLEEVFHQLEMDIPENITFKHYEII
jgi:hypothetical protein